MGSPSFKATRFKIHAVNIAIKMNGITNDKVVLTLNQLIHNSIILVYNSGIIIRIMLQRFSPVTM